MWDVEEIAIPGSVTGAIIICVLNSRDDKVTFSLHTQG